MTRLDKVTFYLLFAIPFLTVIAYGTVHQPLIALFYALVAIAACMWATGGLMQGEARFSRTPLQVPLLVFGIYALVQIIPFGTVTDSSGVGGVARTLSVDAFSTQVTAFHIFALCIFFSLALIYLDSAHRLKRLVTVLTVFGFIYGFYAILQSLLSPTRIYGIYGPANAIPFGSFVNRHNFAALMEMLIAIPLGLLFVGAVGRDKRLLYIVAVALMGSSLLLSGSRGGLVAMIAEIIILIIVTARSRGRKNILLKAGLSALLLVAAVGGAMFVGGDTSLTRFTDTAAAQDITSNRTQIWTQTLKVIAHHVPFGAGIGAYAQAYTPFDPASGFERVEQAHNDYLQVLADAGLVGLVIGSLFLFWFVRTGLRNVREGNNLRRGIAVGAFAGCCAILVHSIFDFVLHITAISVMFLTFMALLVASGRTYEDDVENDDDGMPRSSRSGTVTSMDSRHRRSSRRSQRFE